MSTLSTHVLDTALGRPASGVPIALEKQAADGSWQALGQGQTDSDGRLKTLLPTGATLQPGDYRISFDTKAYFSSTGQRGFYPEVRVVFTVAEASGHLHVPLLLSPFGYSTYRGS